MIGRSQNHRPQHTIGEKKCNPQILLSDFTMLAPWVNFIGEAFCSEHGWIESTIISTQSTLQKTSHHINQEASFL